MDKVYKKLIKVSNRKEAEIAMAKVISAIDDNPNVFDKQTGNPTHGITVQGYSDNSAWARGHAWAVYGLPLSYQYVEKEEQRDSSCAPVVVCGLLEMMKHSDKNKDVKSNGILMHGAYNIPGNIGVDECCIWGDYFYMEALVRMMKKDWIMYW